VVGVTDYAVIFSTGRLTLRNVTLGPAPNIVVAVGVAGTVLRLEGVVVTGGRGAGVIADRGGMAELEDVLVQDITEPVAEFGGNAVATRDSSAITALRAVFRSTAGSAVRSFTSSTVDLEQVAIVDPVPDDGSGRPGLVTGDDGTITGRAVVVEDRTFIGIGQELRTGAGRYDLDGLIVRNTTPRSDGEAGRAISLGWGTTARFAHALVDVSNDVAVVVSDAPGEPASSLTAADLVVRDTQPRQTTSENGIAIGVEGDGTRLEVDRALVVRSVAAGVLLQSGASGTLRDVTVVDVEASRVDGRGGTGLFVLDSASVTVDRLATLRTASRGFAVQAARGDLRDVSMEEIFGRGDSSGFAFGVLEGELSLERALVRDAPTGYGYVAEGSRAIITDLSATEARGGPSGANGYGLSVAARSTVVLTRAALESQRYFGIGFAFNPEPSALQDVRVADTALGTCAGCAATVGHGVTVLDTPVQARRFDLSGNATCGLLIDRAEVDIETGTIAGNLIGACLRGGYDLSRLTTDVFYDNETNLDSTELPLPEVEIPETMSGL
jgi:hypothetical protein